MHSKPDLDPDSNDQNPLNEFSGCHQGIIENFKRLRNLTTLTRQSPSDRSIKKLARQLIDFFHKVVLTHHAEEEQELFAAVMECTANPQQASLARNYIKHLVFEHRQLETMWQMLEPAIKRLAKGKIAQLDDATAGKLVDLYLIHAKFEEQHFLPLAAKMLSKNDLSALGLSLHMRHQKNATEFYI